MEVLLATAKIWIGYLARSVEMAAALIIGVAAVQATICSLFLFFRPGAPPEAKNGVRLTLGRWLAVALELELAADILNTAVKPSAIKNHELWTRWKESRSGTQTECPERVWLRRARDSVAIAKAGSFLESEANLRGRTDQHRCR